eukprot:714691-Pleurochrysis_carterae.AAC.1
MWRVRNATYKLSHANDCAQGEGEAWSMDEPNGRAKSEGGGAAPMCRMRNAAYKSSHANAVRRVRAKRT